MKKTLFLSAILGAALCSSAFGALNQVLDASGTITSTSNDDHYYYATTGGALTYGCNINVGSYSPWIGPGPNAQQQPAPATGAAYVELNGVISGSGALRLNEWTRDVVYKLTGATATTPFSGSIQLNHGGAANNTVQLSLGNHSSAYTALSSASVSFENDKNKQVLSIEGDVTLAGLVTNEMNSWVTSDNANNTLTLNVASGSKSYAGKVGTGNYFSGYSGEGTSFALTSVASKTLKLVKTGNGTQTLKGETHLSSLDINAGTLEIKNGLSTTIASVRMLNSANLKVSGANTDLTVTTLSDFDTKSPNFTLGDSATLTVNSGVWLTNATMRVKRTAAGNGGTMNLVGFLSGPSNNGYVGNLEVEADCTLNITGTASTSSNRDGFLIWSKASHVYTINGTLHIANGIRAQKLGGDDAMSKTNASFNISSTGELRLDKGITFVSDAETLEQLGTINVNGGTLSIGGITTGNKAVVNLKNGAKVVAIDADTTTAQVFDIVDGATVTFNGNDNTLTLNGAINAASSTVNVQGNVVMNGAVNVSGISGTGDLALNTAMTVNTTSSVGSISGSGTLTLNADLSVGGDVTIESLTLNSGADLTADNHNGDVTTSALTVTANGSEMNANLVIAEGGTMDFSSGATLTMGCTVTIGDDVTVIVSSDVLNYISRGEAMTIMYGVDNDTLESITLGDVHFTMDGQERSDFFFMTEADTVNGGMKLMVAPEPATATLSLLALAGLAARRRRH